MTGFTRGVVAATTASALVFSACVPAYAFELDAQVSVKNTDDGEQCVRVNPLDDLVLEFKFDGNNKIERRNYYIVKANRNDPDVDLKNALLAAKIGFIKKYFYGKPDVVLPIVDFGDTGVDATVTFTIPRAVIQRVLGFHKNEFLDRDISLKFAHPLTISSWNKPDGTYYLNRNEKGESVFKVKFCKDLATSGPGWGSPLIWPESQKQGSSDQEALAGKIIGGILGSILGLSLLGFLVNRFMPKHAPAAPNAPVKGIVKGVAK